MFGRFGKGDAFTPDARMTEETCVPCRPVQVSGARSGRKRTHSGLQVMQLQALFNVLCNPQQE